jgi:hypothetical protein
MHSSYNIVGNSVKLTYGATTASALARSACCTTTAEVKEVAAEMCTASSSCVAFILKKGAAPFVRFKSASTLTSAGSSYVSFVHTGAKKFAALNTVDVRSSQSRLFKRKAVKASQGEHLLFALAHPCSTCIRTKLQSSVTMFTHSNVRLTATPLILVRTSLATQCFNHSTRPSEELVRNWAVGIGLSPCRRRERLRPRRRSPYGRLAVSVTVPTLPPTGP